MPITKVLDAIRRRPSPAACAGEHRFRPGWEFCLDCGWYKRDIPAAKGGSA